MVPGLEFSDASGNPWSCKLLKARWRAMPLGLRIVSVLMLICMALPLAALFIIWYLMWYLPLKLMRKRSGPERGRQLTTEPPRRSSTVPAPFGSQDEFQLVITGVDIHARPIVERRRRNSSFASDQESLLSPKRGRTPSQESLPYHARPGRDAMYTKPPVPSIAESFEPHSPQNSTFALSRAAPVKLAQEPQQHIISRDS